MKNVIIIKYGELWLKSEPVRKRFVKRLAENISRMLKADKVTNFKLIRLRDMLILETKSKKAIEVLKRVFGISWFGKAEETEPDMKSIEKAALGIAERIKPDETFAIRASRSDKSAKFTSKCIEERIGGKIERKVNLSDPDFTIFIEIKKEKAYVYPEKIKGLGGLPYGVSGRVLSLISGGFDSPVASWLMMKRGCEVNFVYFHPEVFTGRKTLEKVKETVKKLGEYSPGSVNFYAVPFSEIQTSVIEKCERRMTCVLCRRSMYRTAQTLASKIGGKALVTGENLAQVASQTLDNLFVESDVLEIPIFRPLIGMDKEEVIVLSKKIGTHDLSIGMGCCSLSPKKPSTKARLNNILAEEKRIKELDKLIRKAVENSERMVV
ncbi:MAG: tRNA uracil 4-sulfurtransferase ThiI [Candidatus Aenigmarchaeota archaeon]